MLDFEVGDVIAERYEIKKVLGAGGMGKVYRARQLDLGRDVALKVPSEAVLQNPDIMARFIREARTVAKLTHENVVQIYEYDVKPDRAFIAMEFVEGRDLKEFISKQTPGLNVGDMGKILHLACEGIHHAHENGIVHRDIKPHNIMVAALGRGRWRVKVMDFGIAHLDANSQFTDMGDGQLTQTGQALGTPSYMSPEQIRGSSISVGTDIYSFGCVIYYCFTRQTVFTGSGLTVAVAHLNERPPSLSARVRNLPSKLDQLIQRCLEKEVSKRPSSISDVGDELMEILESHARIPMEEIWAEGLQAPDANIPIIAAPESEASGGTGGKLIEVQTQGTLAMTDSPQGGAAQEATIPAASPLSEASPGRSSGARPSAEMDATVAVGSPGVPIPGIQSGAAMPSASTMPGSTTVVPQSQNKMLLLIGGVAACFIVIGVVASVLMGGRGNSEVILADEPARDVATTNGVILPEVPSIIGKEDGDDLDLAVVIPPRPATEVSPTPAVAVTPAPTSPPVATTPTPRPTSTPVPTPTMDVRRLQVEELHNRARNTQDFMVRIQTWESIMQRLDPGDAAFNELLLSYADEVAMMVVRAPVLVPVVGGRFTMGENRNVLLTEFEMGRFEVTALEFATFLNANSNLAPTLFSPGNADDPLLNVFYSEELGRYRPRPSRANHPANGVSWVAAEAYARWVSRETGRLFRLPTEAEWERAARGTTQNRFPWGSTSPSATDANFNRAAEGTMPVNTMNTGFTGMNHLVGNVAEWCLDWFAHDAYEREPNATDPKGPELEGARRDRRVLRGGSFMDRNPEDLDAARRNSRHPEDQVNDVGFRLAIGVPH